MLHSDMSDCDNDEDSSGGSSDEIQTRSTTSDWTAYSRASEPSVTVQTLDPLPCSTSFTLEYDDWPTLTDDELRSLQHVIYNDPVLAYIPLPRAIPIGTVQVLFNK